MSANANTQKPNIKKPHVLIILDGWGHRVETDANAIALANTPNWDTLWSNETKTLVSGSGMDVGLPDGQMGNSEVGHMNLGAGRVVYQDLTRINKAIEDRSFFSNEAICKAIDSANSTGGAIHILGLLSEGGVHSHQEQIEAAIELAIEKNCPQIYMHAFLDGRDTPPRSAEPSLRTIDQKLRSNNKGQIASIVGRYYAMDRDNRWDRIESAYALLTEGKAEYHADDALKGLDLAYARDENDEFVQATAIKNRNNDEPITISKNDAVVFMNFRADRARQISRAFVDSDFSDFERKVKIDPKNFVTLTQYAQDIKAPCAFAPSSIKNDIGEYLASLNKTQLRIAETEKYAHVTFFFSGGQEELYQGESRELIPSPKVATYDLQPEMSAFELTNKLCHAIRSQEYDFIVCNYANGDMVGHTGVLDAAIKAAETIDKCLGDIKLALEEVSGECLITADHGNLEMMVDKNNNQALTSHTCEPVPLIYLGRNANLKANGLLSDVAPTMLDIMDVEIPEEMTGSSLISFE